MTVNLGLNKLISTSLLVCSFTAAWVTPAYAGKIVPTLINGKPVAAGTWEEVVYIRSSGGSCTATVVGPRVIITAAHCATTGSSVTFNHSGKKYTAKMTRSSLYPGKDHDVSLGLLTEDIVSAKPKTIGGIASKGLGITLLGYGCINEGGGGGNDGILRIGESVITGFSGYDIVSSSPPSGAALCFGDSGGPAFIADKGEDGAVLIGINSKGNISDTNYNTRLDSTESQSFLRTFATNNRVDICGINGVVCTDEPNPPAATCKLTANPQNFLLGESVTLSMTATNATSGDIDGASVSVPSGSKLVTPSATGTFTARGRVDGKGGSGTCEATYTVTNTPPPGDRPTCTLSAVPQRVKLGENITIEIIVQGKADYASIDGASVTFPTGKSIITTKLKGDFSSNGFVRGAGGSSNCYADYTVIDDGIPIPPSAPAYTITTSNCGTNILASSGIKSVCIGVVKKASATEALSIQSVLLLTYSDGAKETMPVLSTKVDSSTQETWTLYSNKTVLSQNFQVLDTKTATLTKNSSGAYTAIEGRSARGNYYIVESM